MNRPLMVSKVASLIGAAKYLEVGVSDGKTFLSVQCAAKFAVNTSFQIDIGETETGHPGCRFRQMTSDEYFFRQAAADGPFDVIFLDGLHTSEQIIKDFLNATAFLSPGGVIFIDDVCPNSYLSSLRSQRMAAEVKRKKNIPDQSWMGDVYKIVAFIESFCQQYTYHQPDEYPFLLLVWRAPRNPVHMRARLISQIESTTFEETVIDPTFYQRLPLAQICDLIASSHTARTSENPIFRLPANTQAQM